MGKSCSKVKGEGETMEVEVHRSSSEKLQMAEGRIACGFVCRNGRGEGVDDVCTKVVIKR